MRQENTRTIVHDSRSPRKPSCLPCLPARLPHPVLVVCLPPYHSIHCNLRIPSAHRASKTLNMGVDPRALSEVSAVDVKAIPPTTICSRGANTSIVFRTCYVTCCQRSSKRFCQGLRSTHFCFFSAGLRIWKEHSRDSSTLIMAPALSNSPQ